MAHTVNLGPCTSDNEIKPEFHRKILQLINSKSQYQNMISQ